MLDLRLESKLVALDEQLSLRALVKQSQDLQRELDVARDNSNPDEEAAITARLATVTASISARIAPKGD